MLRYSTLLAGSLVSAAMLARAETIMVAIPTFEGPITGPGEMQPSIRPGPEGTNLSDFDYIGDPKLASSWHCGGDLKTKEAVCMDLVTKFQKETLNALDTNGLANPAQCNANAEVPVR